MEIGASIAKSDAGNLFQFAALISINLPLSTFPSTSFGWRSAGLLASEGLWENHCPFKTVSCKPD